MLAVLSSCAVVLLLAANTASAAYPYTATLAPDYTLNWDYDTVKQVISFQMVYTNGTAWCVCAHLLPRSTVTHALPQARVWVLP